MSYTPLGDSFASGLLSGLLYGFLTDKGPQGR